MLKKAEEQLCSVLSNEEKWELFEENSIQSPGIENIRKHLDKAYKKKTKNDKHISSNSFLSISSIKSAKWDSPPPICP